MGGAVDKVVEPIKKTFKARLDSTKTSEAFEKMVEEAKKIQD